MSVRLRVAVLLLAAVAIAGGCTACRSSADDWEDRPPIIVKNGSIIFESGAKGRPGKPWKKFQGLLFQDHERGKPVSSFQLYFRGGTGACEPVSVTDFSITFDDDTDPTNDPKIYSVTIRMPGSGGRPGIALSGSGIDIDSSNAMRVIGGTTGVGRILSATGTGFSCHEPTEIYVESVR